MRVIQTSDIHLDRSYAGLELPPNAGAQCRRHLFDTLKAILARAVAWPADAVVICGDLFEHDRVTRTTVKQLRDAFAAIQPIRVLICPGRHDPCQSGSPYLTDAWPDNVHCFKSPAWETVLLDHVPLALHGFGWDRPDYGGGLPASLDIHAPNHTNLAFGYGLSRQFDTENNGTGTQVDPAIALPGKLDYLGLGESHVGKQAQGPQDTPVYFSGAPVDHDFSDAGPFEFLEIEAEKAGAPVTVTPRKASDPQFGNVSIDCSVLDSGQALIDAVRQALDTMGGVSFLRLTLEGELPRQVYAELDGIRETIADSVQYLQLRDNCQLAEDYGAIAREHTSLGAFIARITSEIGDAPTPVVRSERQRSRDLGLCAYRSVALPVRGLAGDPR